MKGLTGHGWSTPERWMMVNGHRLVSQWDQVLGDKPEGGQWNFDHDNRGSFPKGGPGLLPAPVAFPPDPITAEVLTLVGTRFARHAGNLASFDWPLTPAQAQLALADFIAHRLALFGQYQDAIWTGEPWLYHSRLAAAMR